MTKFAQMDDKFIPTRDIPPVLIDKLPPQNYVVDWHDKGGYYITRGEPFVFPQKVYGALPRQRERIINTFKDRELSTGVLLSGEKGSGKTLLAKGIAKHMVELGYPALLVNRPYRGNDFAQFLTSIRQPSVVLFDEFEKVYNDEIGAQEGLLTLLDGVFPTKKLFVLTCNDKWKINDHMKNRPGRIFYMLEFQGLGGEFITEYCKDNLRESLHGYIPKLVALSGTFKAFNFDMLKAVVEEMNRYCEEPKDALVMLNIKPESFFHQKYMLGLEVNGHKVPTKMLSTKQWTGDPQEDFRLNVQFRYPLDEKKKASVEANVREQLESRSKAVAGSTPPKPVSEEAFKTLLEVSLERAEMRSLIFTSEDYVRTDALTGSLIFEIGDGQTDELEEILEESNPPKDFKKATLTLTRVYKPSYESQNPYEYL